MLSQEDELHCHNYLSSSLPWAFLPGSDITWYATLSGHYESALWVCYAVHSLSYPSPYSLLAVYGKSGNPDAVQAQFSRSQNFGVLTLSYVTDIFYENSFP